MRSFWEAGLPADQAGAQFFFATFAQTIDYQYQPPDSQQIENKPKKISFIKPVATQGNQFCRHHAPLRDQPTNPTNNLNILMEKQLQTANNSRLTLRWRV